MMEIIIGVIRKMYLVNILEMLDIMYNSWRDTEYKSHITMNIFNPLAKFN